MSDARDRETIERGLLKKGFVKKIGGDHHRYILLSRDGKKTSVHTKTSRGTQHKRIEAPLIALMARQCRLSTKDFVDFVDCPMTEEAYRVKIKTHGVD